MSGRCRRILHVVTTLDPGGAENHLRELVDEMVRRGHRVAVAYLRGDPANEARLRAVGAEVWRVGESRRPGPLVVARLARLLTLGQYDVVHAHLVEGEIVAMTAHVLADRAAFVVTKHNDDPFWRRQPVRTAANAVARHADAVIAISDHVKQSFVDLGFPADRVARVHYGLPTADESIGRAEARRLLGLPEDAQVVGSVGRLVEQKGHETLVEAGALLTERFPRLRIALVGAGPLETRLRALADQRGIADRVSFAGWRADGAGLMTGFDIFAQPSRWEGFGLVLLEAMARGRPVVATRVSAIPEIVIDGETGLLVPPNDVPALADALAALLGDPARADRLGTAGRTRLLHHFTVERMVTATLDLYDRANVRHLRRR